MPSTGEMVISVLILVGFIIASLTWTGVLHWDRYWWRLPGFDRNVLRAIQPGYSLSLDVIAEKIRPKATEDFVNEINVVLQRLIKMDYVVVHIIDGSWVYSITEQGEKAYWRIR